MSVMPWTGYIFIRYKTHTISYPGGDAFLVGGRDVDKIYTYNGICNTSNLCDGVQPKMSPTISFSGMYRKSFIYRRNRTNSQ